MNPELDKLRIKAGISRIQDDYRLIVITKDGQVTDPLNGLEKFAELIIDECCNKSLELSHRSDDMGAIIANNIKQHFGVE